MHGLLENCRNGKFCRITFHYTVAWTDSDDSLARRYEILKASLKKHPKMIQPEREFQNHVVHFSFTPWARMIKTHTGQRFGEMAFFRA